MTNPKYKKRGNFTNKEIDSMLKKAEKLPTEYFKLRTQCLIALAKKFGKRRIEISRLERKDLTVNNETRELEVRFTLAKKRKRGLHQFFKHLEKHNPTELSKPLPILKAMWREWQKTEEGHSVNEQTALKSIDLKDKYAPYILLYFDYLEQNYPEVKYLFPSGYPVFGSAYVVEPGAHLSGSQLLRLIKPLTNGWLHLFRSTKGEETARQHGRTLESLHNVATTLNVTDQTAMHYIEKYVPQKQPIET